MEPTTAIKYPCELAPRGDTIDEYPKADGTTAKVNDAYRFLEDPDTEATKAWVTAQNTVTEDYLGKCELREKINGKMTQVWNYAKIGLVNRHGEHYYFNYNSGLQNQFVQYRITEKRRYKLNEDNALEGAEVFLDPNSLAEDGTAAVSGNSWSEDGRYMAYQVKRGGSDWATIHIRDAQTCQDVSSGDTLSWVKFSGTSWTKDSKGFFYSKFDSPEQLKDSSGMEKAGTETEQLKFQKVYYHRVGTKQEEDVLIYQDKNEAEWMFDASVSDDGNHLFISVRRDCNDINLVYHADLTKPENAALNKEIEMTQVINEWIGGFDVVHNEGSRVFFKTNLDAPRSKIIAIDLANPAKENWQDILAEHSNNVLQFAMCVNGQLAVAYLQDASDRLHVYDYSSPANLLHEVKLPDIGTVVGISGKYNDSELLYKFSSFTDPGSSYRVDMANNFATERLSVTKLAEGAPDVTEFVTDQVKFKSKDGTEVPMFVVRMKSTLASLDDKPAAPIPTLVYGYGGFNISLTPTFSITRLVFLANLKGMLAVVNMRGGGEYGEDWHHAGTKEKKQNVFDDFMGACDYLQAQGYTAPQQTAIMGGSNGGLLVSACANQRPDLFGTVISQVPVADMLRFHKFTIGHFWCSDFGCSEKEGGFDYLIEYSPLHTVKAQIYPAMMVLTADHDDRVVPLHTFKLVAELQHQAGAMEGQRPLLARIEVNAGHGAGKPTHKIIAEASDIYAFIAKNSGATWTD